ncbi:hypothetical protein M758_UG254600 [Ceratodon purpureus]|nr:hypothetical protein M758_UG254600 [Ceratodon purpureus]
MTDEGSEASDFSTVWVDGGFYTSASASKHSSCDSPLAASTRRTEPCPPRPHRVRQEHRGQNGAPVSRLAVIYVGVCARIALRYTSDTGVQSSDATRMRHCYLVPDDLGRWSSGRNREGISLVRNPCWAKLKNL